MNSKFQIASFLYKNNEFRMFDISKVSLEALIRVSRRNKGTHVDSVPSLFGPCVDFLSSSQFEFDCTSRLPCRLDSVLPAAEGYFLPSPITNKLIVVLDRRNKLSERLLNVFFAEECGSRPEMLPLFA